MVIGNFNLDFPLQRVSGEVKNTEAWYSSCIDYIIEAGLAIHDRNQEIRLLDILHGNMPGEFYKKTLNPYNASQEKYKRFPATLRNYDIMSDIIRRYISEYFKGTHEFIVGSNNPDIIINKNAKLKEEISIKAQEAFREEFEKNYQQLIQQAQQNGTPTNQIDPKQAMPDPKQFVEDFNKKYVDDETKQGQDLLDYIRDSVEDTTIYLSAYFNWVALGECYTYTDIRNGNIIKESIPVTDAYPIPNNSMYVKNHDMFAHKIKMSVQQIFDTFDNFLTDKDRNFLTTFYEKGISTGEVTTIRYDQLFEQYPDMCNKFGERERELFKKEPVTVYEKNNNLLEVWHVVWRGDARVGILTYINQVGFQTTRTVEEDYKIDKANGDISIEWTYEPQVYEGYRIGSRYTALYPIKARPVIFNRKGELPYNGIMEVLPQFGKFSIIEAITPFQVMRNIFIYHREMLIAKNKLYLLMIPESLVAGNAEDKIYKMAADGVLLVDDTEDRNTLAMQQIRMLSANVGEYIRQMSDLIESIKLDAREIVDMNVQRYGQIAQSAGASTTQQAVTQSAMGSIIINQMFDEMRKLDYNRDLDFAKLAFVDGLDTSFWDNDTKQRKYISLDVNSFINSDNSVTVRNNGKELDKLNQLRNWAFSAAQNGDLDIAVAAIKGDNVTQISSTVERFMEIKRKHESDMQQMDQQLKQMDIQSKLQQIAAKGEEDRKTEEIKYYYEMQLKYQEVNMSMLNTEQPEDKTVEHQQAATSEQNKVNIENNKLNVERQKLALDTYNQAADRQVKLQDINTRLKIAKTNKNKYDK